MLDDYKGILVIIPTRNRADLAINAIMSVLNQPNCEDVEVLVSDNSTDIRDIELLYRFCKENNSERLRYIRPSEPLSMTKHWDWAINQALDKYPVNHFLYLTDRMIFKDGQLQEIKNIVKIYPEYIISYDYDRVADHKKPVRIELVDWTGKLYRVQATRLLWLSSKACLHPLPKMLNSVAPRSVLNQIAHKFGSIFSSISPDYNFSYRSLAIVDSILHFDKAIIVHYAISQSNGASFARGMPSKASKDFIDTLGQSSLCSSSPIPDLQTVGNAIWHEYCEIKKEIGGNKFPDIDMKNYLIYIASEVKQIENFDLRSKMEETLFFYRSKENLNVDNYFHAKKNLTKKSLSITLKKLLSPKVVLHKITTILIRSRYIQQILSFLACNYRINFPNYINNFLSFSTTEEALRYINRSPKSKSKSDTYLIQQLGDDYLEID